MVDKKETKGLSWNEFELESQVSAQDMYSRNSVEGAHVQIDFSFVCKKMSVCQITWLCVG